jgi:hypothetical protein
MWKRFGYSSLVFAFCVGCTKEPKREASETGNSILQGLYMERIYLDDNGMPEQDLLLSCDTSLFNSVTTKTVVIQTRSVKIFLPCVVLKEIEDSLSKADSTTRFGDARVVWNYHRIIKTDTSFTAPQKYFEYIAGKKHLWWMLDEVLRRHPDAFKTAKWGRQPFPRRVAPYDSAWLDTVKQGLF